MFKNVPELESSSPMCGLCNFLWDDSLICQTGHNNSYLIRRIVLGT